MSENSPSLVDVVPNVVFCANTLAPGRGSRVSESTIFPVTVICENTGIAVINANNTQVTNSLFIEND